MPRRGRAVLPRRVEPAHHAAAVRAARARGVVDELRARRGRCRSASRSATFLVQTHVSYGLVATATVCSRASSAPRSRRGDDAPTPSTHDRMRSWLRVAGRHRGGRAWCSGCPSWCNRCATSPATSGTLSASSGTTGASTATATRGTSWRRSSASGPTGCTANVVRNIYSGASRPERRDADRGLGPRARRRRGRARGDGPRTRSVSTCVLVLTIVVAVVSVSRIVGDIFPYLVTWTWAVGMLTWLAIAWSVVRWWQTRGATDPRVGRIALGVAAVGARGRRGREHGRRRHRRQPRSATLAAREGTGGEGARRAARPATASSRSEPARRRARHGSAPASPRSSSVTASTRGCRPDLGFAYGPDRVLGDEHVRLVVLPVEDTDLAATRQNDCFEDAGRVGTKVERYTLFLGDPLVLVAVSYRDGQSRSARAGMRYPG